MVLSPFLLLQGFEHATEVEYPLQASTCCKHFVANGGRGREAESEAVRVSRLPTPPLPPRLLPELDAWNGSTRHTFNAIVTQQDLADSCVGGKQEGWFLSRTSLTRA